MELGDPGMFVSAIANIALTLVPLTMGHSSLVRSATGGPLLWWMEAVTHCRRTRAIWFFSGLGSPSAANNRSRFDRARIRFGDAQASFTRSLRQ